MKSCFIAFAIGAGLITSRLVAQQPFVMATGGRMMYDAAGDTWHGSRQIAAGVALADERVRVGIDAEWSSIGFDTLGYAFASTEHYTRMSIFAEWDVARYGGPSAVFRPSVFVRGGFGYVRSVGHPPRNYTVPAGADEFWFEGQSGLTAMIGSGVRVPIASRVALEGGLDFHYDELFDGGLRDWSWSTGISITP